MEVLSLIIALIKRGQEMYDHRQFVGAVEVVLIDWIRDRQLPDWPTLVDNVKEKGLAQRLIEANTKEAMAKLLKDFAILERQELSEDEFKLLNHLRTTLEVKLASPGESMILEDTRTIARQQDEMRDIIEEVRDSLSASRNNPQNLNFDEPNQAGQPFASQFVQDVNQQLNSIKKLIDNQWFDGARVLLEQLQQETAEREPDLPSQTQYRIYANWGAIYQGSGEFEKAARP